jgi:opacity protein-like surface antigen
MKKTLLLTLLVALFISFSSSAQTKFGLRAGINLSKENAKALGISFNSDSKVGLTVGGFAEINLTDGFALQPEFNFSQMGGKLDGVSETLNFLTIPAFAKFKFGSFSAFAGPQLGILLSANYKDSGITESSTADYKTTDFSAIGGMEYVFGENFLINARYQIGLSNVIKEPILGESQKNNGFTFSIGYRF